MTAVRRISDDLSRELDGFDDRLRRAERDRGDMSDHNRGEAEDLRVRAAALRARLRDTPSNRPATAELGEEWTGLFAAFENWIARLDERQDRFNL